MPVPNASRCVGLCFGEGVAVVSAPVALSVEPLHEACGGRVFRAVVSVGTDFYKVRFLTTKDKGALILGCETKTGRRPSDDRYMPVCFAALDAVQL